ncbi:MAG: prepilin-type N-terminal cleavage/methylation domain-containing protein [Cystobacter sp.]
MKRTHRQSGFSLVEMMTVVGIIAILSALSLVALEVLPQRTRLTGGALEFAAVISSARSQAYGRNQRVVVLINADTANVGNPIRYWVVVDKWSNMLKAMENLPSWSELNQLTPGPPAPAGNYYPVYDSGHFNPSVRVLNGGFKTAVVKAADGCNTSLGIGLARGQPSLSDDIFPPPFCYVPSNKACTFCSGDGASTPLRGAIVFEPDGSVRFADAQGKTVPAGSASITLLPTGGGGLQGAQAVVITNTGIVRTFTASR